MALEIRNDDEIMRDLTLAVESDTRLLGVELQLDARSAVIHLGGHVQHYWQKQLLFERITQILGVIGIEGDVEIQPPVKPSDFTIAQTVESLLSGSGLVDANGINVQCLDGVVLMNGTVSSLDEQRRAEECAWGVRGVIEIRDRLVVSPAVHRTDREILEEIRGILSMDPRLDLATLKIQVVDRVVTLEGNVTSLAQRSLAEAIVHCSRSAVGVHNRISVVP